MFNIKDIWDIQDGQVVLNEHILNIPVLRAVKEAYKNPIPAFQYLRYRYDMKGPYSDAPEDEKDEILMKDFPGEYTLEDPAISAAIEWFEGLMTPTQRFYRNSKMALERLGDYMATAEIEAGRDGNISAIAQQLGRIGKTIVEFRQLEKIVEQEMEEQSKNKNRGNAESAYDEDN